MRARSLLSTFRKGTLRTLSCASVTASFALFSSHAVCSGGGKGGCKGKRKGKGKSGSGSGSCRRESTTSTTGIAMPEAIRDVVTEYYGKVLSRTEDLKTSACTAFSKPHDTIIQILKKVPNEVMEKFYGCGNPIPFGIEGLTVVDLGSGSGRDCYVCAALVGESGKVIGVDMTEEQLAVSRSYVDDFCTDALGFIAPNLEFRHGLIEALDDPKGANIAAESVDLVISNCVVNLSPRKDQVLRGVYSILKEGGEFYFSDVYCDRRLSEEARKHDVLVGECIGGALYTEDFRRICQDVGFADVRVLSSSPIEVVEPTLKKLVGNAKFYSITYRLFKAKAMEDVCEDYGQVAVYKGTIEEHPNAYELDDHHLFETGKPMLVCGNTAAMCGESWLSPHFEVTGDRSTHYGKFKDCSSGTNSQSTSGSAPEDSCCAPDPIGNCC